MIKRILVLLALAINAFGAPDTRLGVDTQFHNQANQPANYSPGILMPVIGQTPFGYIRDDIGWTDNELVQGQYGNPTGGGLRAVDQAWIDGANAIGIKPVVVLIQYYTPSFYANPSGWVADSSGTSPAARFCAWLAKTESGKISAIEVFNEPNNSQSIFGPSNVPFATACAQATQLIARAVHQAAPGLPVIGYGAQGQQVLDMLEVPIVANGDQIDGVVYHPYDDGSGFPERVYEPYTGQPSPPMYLDWVKKLKSVTSLPIWETECGGDRNGSGSLGNVPNSRSEYWSALWFTRRLTLALSQGVAHTFLFDMSDYDSIQSIVDYDRFPRAQYYSISNWSKITSGLSFSAPVTETSSDPAFDTADFLGFYFSGNTGFAAISWLGSQPPARAGEQAFAPKLATLSWPAAKAPAAIDSFNLISGNRAFNLPFTYASGTVTVPNVPVGPDPIALVPGICSAAPSPTPTPTPTPTPSPTPCPTYQTGSGAYGVTFSKPELAGDTVVALVPPTGITFVADNNGDTFVKTATGITVNGTVYDQWTATNIKGASWGVSTTDNITSGNGNNPQMIVSELSCAPAPTPTPTPNPTPTPTPAPGGIHPVVTLPSNFSLVWSQDFTSSAYANINTSGVLDPQQNRSSANIVPPHIWSTAGVGAPALYSPPGVDHKPFSTDAGYLAISTFDNGDGTDHGGIMCASADNGSGFRATDAYWECKMRLPQGGNSQWPIWWITGGTFGGSVPSIEIDVAESGYQVSPTSTNANAPIHTHLWGSGQSFGDFNINGTEFATNTNGWQVFSVWIHNTGSVEFYLNGKLEFTATTSPANTNQPVFPILQMTNFTGQSQSTLGEFDVQYVRCWTAPPALRRLAH